jgi:acetylornithine deacetylase/succinyl-diaminopimelate desuccinylase-like protein
MGLVGAEHLKKKSWLHGAEVLNSEPSELRLAMGNRGLRIYEIYGSFSKRKKVKGRLYKIEFLGKAAHSARPQLGKNALLMAMKYLTELPEGIYPIALKGGLAANITAPRAVLQVLNTTGHLPSPKKYGGRVRKVRPVSHLIIHPEARAVLKIWFQHLWRHRRGKITQNVGFVDFSEKRWKLVFDLRLPVKGNVRKLEQLIKKYRKITHARIEIERDNPPFLQRKGMALHRQMARILRAQGLSTATDIKWGGTEASVFGQVAREVLTFGPGRLYGVAHQPNEYVPLKELYAVTEVYRELFRGMVRL